jgi:cell division protein FtsB
MVMRRVLAKAGRAAVGPFLAIALIIYFGFNLVQGDHGLRAWLRREHEVKAAQARLDATAAELAAIRHRTDLLMGNHLDPDLLDERARAALNVVGPDEIVIFTPARVTPSTAH